jgi:hypothetical protein
VAAVGFLVGVAVPGTLLRVNRGAVVAAGDASTPALPPARLSVNDRNHDRGPVTTVIAEVLTHDDVSSPVGRAKTGPFGGIPEG